MGHWAFPEGIAGLQRHWVRSLRGVAEGQHFRYERKRVRLKMSSLAEFIGKIASSPVQRFGLLPGGSGEPLKVSDIRGGLDFIRSLPRSCSVWS